MIISSVEAVNQLISTVENNIEKTRNSIQSVLVDNEAKEALAILKFDKSSFDPLSGEPINFIEMLNQSYSNIVVLKAVKDLLLRYPEKSFELHMGALTGYDIEATDHSVVAECFATVTAFSNQKIKKDSEKLYQLSDGIDKFIYFYSRDDSADKISRFTDKYPRISFVRISEFEM